MTLFFIGLLILIVGLLIKRRNPDAKGAFVLQLVGFLAGLTGLLTSFIVQINAGEVGVKSLFGKVDNDILESGLHFVNPLVEVVNFNTKTKNYTMSAVHQEGNVQGDDAIRVLSHDGLEVFIDLTVLYRIEPKKAPNILKEIGKGYEEVIVRPLARTLTRDIAANYDAIEIFSGKREEFEMKVFKGMEATFSKRGLILEQLLVRNITLPASVKAAIETKINAIQESQKMQFILDKERQEAERKRVEAQGIADYQKIISESLTEKQLQYEMIKAQKDLAASPNSKIIIMGGKGNMPLILGADK